MSVYTGRLYLLGFLLTVLLLGACGGELVVLLPDQEGHVGTVAVSGEENMVILDSANAAAKIALTNQAVKEKVSDKSVQRIFGEAISAEPPASKIYMLRFYFNSTQIVPSSKPRLDALFADVASREAVEVQITGHTDSVGSLAENDRLSLRRAEKIRLMLIQNGLKSNFIRAVGRGEREPMVDMGDEVPQPMNRRVEVVVR